MNMNENALFYWRIRMKKMLLTVLSLVVLLNAFGLMMFSAQIEVADVRDDNGNYVGRAFDETFDLMYDDFERDYGIISGTGLISEDVNGSATEFTTPHLKADYNAQVGSSYIAPIYKVGTPVNYLGTYENLVLEMKGFNGASTEDIIVSFRYNDDYTDIEVPLNELLNPELSFMPAFDGTTQKFVISIMNSLDGKFYNLLPGEMGSQEIAADSSIQALHIMSKQDGGQGTLELTRVYFTSDPDPVYEENSPSVALVDDFTRSDVNQPTEDMWWVGSAFQIVGEHLNVLPTLNSGTCDPSLLVDDEMCVDVFGRRIYDTFDRDDLTDTVAADKWWFDTNAAIDTEEEALLFSGDGSEVMLFRTAGPTNNNSILYPYLVLTMKGDEETSIDSLRIGTADAQSGPVSVSELVDHQGNALPELTVSYQTFIIDLDQSGLEVNHLGIELYFGDDGKASNLWVSDIGYANASIPSGIDQPGMYRSLGEANANRDGLYDNVVIKARSNASIADLFITPIYVNEGVESYGEKMLLSEALGPDGLAVPVMNQTFTSYVINFSENGWDKKVSGFIFETPADQPANVYIDEIFFTNMEFDMSLIDTEYPVFDLNTIKVFDHFEREEVGATLDYDAANPTAIAADLDFMIAYAGFERMSMEDGNLVFDTTENDAYMQYTVGSGNRSNDGSYEYLVFKLKGTDGALLNLFRFQTIDLGGVRQGILYADGSVKSGNGLDAASSFDDTTYPYVTEDGYVYLIVDLASSGIATDVSGFDLFYSGGGKLYIDAIFFANKDTSGQALDLDALDALLNEYVYPVDMTCEAGYEMINGSCVEIEEPVSCDDGQTNVDGTCVNTIVDPNSCTEGEVFSNGSCVQDDVGMRISTIGIVTLSILGVLGVGAITLGVLKFRKGGKQK